MISAIDDLIDIKVLIRKIVPNYELDEQINHKFLTLLESLKDKLDPIFNKYLIQNNLSKQDNESQSKKKKILDLLTSGNFALISANSSKKKLKNLGINPKYLIVTGGPFFIEDYHLVNPNIPENALEGMKKKIDRLLKQLKDKNWNDKHLFFIRESSNPTDNLILKRLGQISELINKEIKCIEINSWKDLDN